MSIEPDPLSGRRILVYIFLAIALVILPSIITTKRVEVQKPATPRAEIINLGLTAYAEEEPTPEVVPETAPEPPQEPVVAKTVVTPPPVEKPVTEPPVQPRTVGSGSCETEIYKYDWNHSTALAVARAESGLNPGALNNNPRTKDYSVGCFQINLYGANAKSRPSEATLKQASENVAFAYKIYKSNGSSFVGQWGVCKKISCY